MTDLHSLLTRVEAATGPDRELDHAILMITPAGAFLRDHGYERIGDGYFTSRPPIAGGAKCSGAQLYTASLDAALALVGEMLPGSEFEMGSTSPPEGEGQFWAVVWARQKSKRISQIATANTLPLAVLSALLRALIAKQEVADAEG